MSFWDSFDNEMERSGSQVRLTKTMHDETEYTTVKVNGEINMKTAYETEELNEDSYIIAGNQAFEEGRFENAMDYYLKSINRGNMHALLSLADLMAFSVFVTEQGEYWIGSDREKDFALELAITLYLFSFFYPRCKDSAKDRLQAIQERCANGFELQRMCQRIRSRFSDAIASNPIEFVKIITNQYRHY